MHIPPNTTGQYLNFKQSLRLVDPGRLRRNPRPRDREKITSAGRNAALFLGFGPHAIAEADYLSGTASQKRIHRGRPTPHMLQVCFTVDMEPDCPPFLNTWRGIEEGADPLMDVLGEEGVRSTFFTTGQVAEKYPETVRSIVGRGHELGCHGFSHRVFTSLDYEAAKDEIQQSSQVLRQFAPVTSFRAPNLQFPPDYLELLDQADFLLDSSQAKYKMAYYMEPRSAPITRVPASVTSSVLRLPAPIRNLYLGALSSPVVLFVHPWEFVDLTRERLRLDCRFKTGAVALECARSVIRFFKDRDAKFVPMCELAT